MLDIHVQLLERSFVQEHIQALTRSQLTLGVLSSDAFLTAAQARGVTLGFKLFDNSLHRRPCFSCDISGDPFSAFTSACNCEFAKSCIHKILSQRRGFPDSLLPCGGGYEGLAACRLAEVGEGFGPVSNAQPPDKLASLAALSQKREVKSPKPLTDLARTLRQNATEAEQRLRSEEHTSELQPLMRTSYAVFCLTTKNY